MPGSHGCIGMAPADAQWFWSFATVGTPIVIHE
jgi:lipoprotein-anchoring transpeptidase ErfK/SrfK